MNRGLQKIISGEKENTMKRVKQNATKRKRKERIQKDE